MGWRVLAASAALAGALVGCKSEPPWITKDDLHQARLPEREPEAVARMQKPDGNPSGKRSHTLLDASPGAIGDPGNAELAVSIRATVNGHPILNEEVRQACRPRLMETLALPESERLAAQQKVLTDTLERLIERELLYQDAEARLNSRPEGKRFWKRLQDKAGEDFDKWLRLAKKHFGAKTDEDLKALMRQEGLSMATLQEAKRREYIASQWLQQRVVPAFDLIGHEQIVEYYHQHPEEFLIADAVQWQDIFISLTDHGRDEARQIAEQVVRRARAGEDFRKLAREVDRDFSFSKGDGYGQKRGSIRPPELEPLLFRMTDGQVSDPVELPAGFHVVRLVHRDYAGMQPLDDKVQTRIRDRLRQEVFERESKRVLADLKSKATIEYTTQKQ
ncbi:MAG TPA: peptidylprolyl isomerase [Gemmataceae bacterium]|nr:peptidylprolyl isomerase [Gemmataceae bacterium]